MNAEAPRPARPPADDLPIRRTWWLLFGAFLVLILVAGVRAATSAALVDWLVVAVALFAAVAAILHRNAVAGLEARGRAEAEAFARIFRGLSRSVSVDAVVGAIVDDLADGTGADHVVVVRRRTDRGALEATLVTRRPGVPSSTSLLPALEASSPPVPSPAEPASVGPGPGTVERLVRRAAAGLEGVGITDHPFRRPASAIARSEVLGTGIPAETARRIADRVRALYGLSHTLTAPLRGETDVAGAIVLSRRDRTTWPLPARRLLEGAAVEVSAALARAYSYREATAHATTDPLTGLPNRRYFDEFCALLARRRRAGDAVAVLMVDIDHFKRLNDSHGHPVGDEVLRAVATAIVSAVRDEDVPARVGGEEFAVLLRNPGPDVAAEVGERVRQAVRTLDLRGHGVDAVSVSVGVANARDADEPIAEIVDRADRALLRAKRGGRDQVIAA